MSIIAPYCVAQDILDTLPRLLGSVSSPNALITTPKIEELCRVISAEMDSRFNKVGYTVPVDTSTNERLRLNLKRIAIDGTCGRVLHTIYKTGEVNFQLGEDYRTQYYRDIQQIEDNGFGDDVPRTRSQGWGPIAGPEYEPVFKKGKRIV